MDGALCLSQTCDLQVRERLIDIQKSKEKRESAIRLREEKKFSVEVQKAREATKHKERRKLTLAVKNHRKGMKDQLEAILNRKSHDQLDDARVSGGEKNNDWWWKRAGI